MEQIFLSVGNSPRPKSKKVKIWPRKGGQNKDYSGSNKSPKKRPREDLDNSNAFDLNRFLNLGIFKTQTAGASPTNGSDKGCYDSVAPEQVISQRSLDLNISVHSCDDGGLCHRNEREEIWAVDSGETEVLAECQIDGEVQATLRMGASIGV
ncbi:hypothetical protein Hanom_Chr14g01271221 [Helianthus anomalus]